MSNEIEWSQIMSDADFVKASEKYFKRSRITLHIGCCLVAKTNPELKSEPVGKGYLNWDNHPDPKPYDYTRRPFLVALRALNGEVPTTELKAAEPLPKKVGDAQEIVVNMRTFAAWALAQWPLATGHIKKAEEHYAKRKSNSPAGYLSNKNSSYNIKWAAIEKEFQKLYASYGASAKSLSNRKLATDLQLKLKGTRYQTEAETLRKKIGSWIK